MVRLVVSMEPAVIAAAVANCPAVAALSAGTTGEVAIYLPGRRIVGVRMAPPAGVAVHVVARFGPTMAEVAAQVRAAIAAVAPDCRPVDVVIDDLELPGAGHSARTPGAGADSLTVTAAPEPGAPEPDTSEPGAPGTGPSEPGAPGTGPSEGTSGGTVHRRRQTAGSVRGARRKASPPASPPRGEPGTQG